MQVKARIVGVVVSLNVFFCFCIVSRGLHGPNQAHDGLASRMGCDSGTCGVLLIVNAQRRKKISKQIKNH